MIEIIWIVICGACLIYSMAAMRHRMYGWFSFFTAIVVGPIAFYYFGANVWMALASSIAVCLVVRSYFDFVQNA